MLTYPKNNSNQIQKTIQTKFKKQFKPNSISNPKHIQNQIQLIFKSISKQIQNSAAGHNRDRGNLKYLYKESIVTEIIRPAMRF